MEVTNELLTVEQAAAYLSIRPWTLRHWVSDRRVTYVKMGNRVRFRVRDLDAFIARNVVKPGNNEDGRLTR